MKPHAETWKEDLDCTYCWKDMDCTYCETDLKEICLVCKRNRCFECKRGCECYFKWKRLLKTKEV